MGNKLRKVIELEIHEMILNRLSCISVGASSLIAKYVKTSSKEIAKKFFKALDNEERNLLVSTKAYGKSKSKMTHKSAASKSNAKRHSTTQTSAVKSVQKVGTKVKTKAKTKAKK